MLRPGFGSRYLNRLSIINNKKGPRFSHELVESDHDELIPGLATLHCGGEADRGGPVWAMIDEVPLAVHAKIK